MRGHGDTETKRQRDKEKGRNGELVSRRNGETGRQEEAGSRQMAGSNSMRDAEWGMGSWQVAAGSRQETMPSAECRSPRTQELKRLNGRGRGAVGGWQIAEKS